MSLREGRIPGSWWFATALVLVLLFLVLTKPTGLQEFGQRNGNASPPPASEPPAPEAAPPEPAPAAVTTVTIGDYFFEPKELVVPAGTIVVWEYPDGKSQHELVLRDFNVRSPRLRPGDTWAYQFDAPGSYFIIDAIFKSMIGKVNVTG